MVNTAEVRLAKLVVIQLQRYGNRRIVRDFKAVLNRTAVLQQATCGPVNGKLDPESPMETGHTTQIISQIMSKA